ncbi:MAG: hypothetical protein AAF800_12585 [Planctomycetota bacterium]
MNPFRRSPAAALTLVVALAGPAASAVGESVWRLTYDVTTFSFSGADNAPTDPITETSTRQVWLAADRFAVVEDGSWQVYDFRDGTLRGVDPGHRLTVVPLIADPLFRVIETQNVIRIHGALLAAGVDDDAQASATGPRDLHDIETRFGLPWPHATPGLPTGSSTITQPEPGTWRLTRGDSVETELVVNLDAEPWPAEIAAAYRLYLLHRCPMHPSLWDRLDALDRPLKHLELRWRPTLSAHHATLWLRSAEPQDAWPDPAAGLGPTVPLNFPSVEGFTPIATWATRHLTGQDLPSRPTAASAFAAADEAVERGRPLDAVLGLIEITLQEGVEVGSRIGPIVEAHADDPQLAAYLAVRQPPSDNGNASVIDKLLALDRAGLRHGHVLDIFIANEATAARRWDLVFPRFAAALNRNPHLTGVWHDLGQLAYRQFDTFTAFACFATARRIAPDHGMLEQTAAFERRVRGDFPRFFP